MTKQEFISMSLPHDLCVVFKEDSGRITGLDFFNEEIYILYKKRYEIAMPLQDVVPIIRPFSDLYKECVQSDYNDGKPFIPIIELAKICFKNTGWDKDIRVEENCNCYTYSESSNLVFRYNEDYGFIYRCDNQIKPAYNQLKLIQEFIKMHFWPNLSKEEQVMYLTQSFDPYKL